MLLVVAVLGLLATSRAQLASLQLASLQLRDGRWSAREDGEPTAADLRVTAWMLLCFLGDGQSSAYGRNREAIVAGLRWLRGRQDEQGRIGFRAEPDWLLDHTFATLVLAEDLRAAPGIVRADRARRAVDALVRELTVRRPPIGAEQRFWAEVVLRSLRAGPRPVDDAERTGHAARADDSYQRLARPTAALTALTGRWHATRPRSDRERAVEVLRRTVRISAASAVDDRPTFPAVPWPDDLMADPWTTFYCTVTAFQIGGATWKDGSKRLLTVVKSQQQPADPRPGTWDPAGAFGERFGRVGTSAVHLLTLEIYYRYCALPVFE